MLGLGAAGELGSGGSLLLGTELCHQRESQVPPAFGMGLLWELLGHGGGGWHGSFPGSTTSQRHGRRFC